MKKGWIFGVLAVLVAAGGAGAGYKYKQAQEENAIDMRHDQVLAVYQQTMANAECVTLNVTEAGKEIGTYTLDDLGILDQTKQTIKEKFRAVDRMSPEMFSELTLEEKQAWDAMDHPQGCQVAVCMDGFDPEPVMIALEGQLRHEAKDAYVVCEDGVYRVEPAVEGNVLIEDRVLEALTQKVSGMTVASDAARAVSFDVTTCDCYKTAAVTEDNADFDFSEYLADDISELSLQVTFEWGAVTETIGNDVLQQMVSVGKDGVVSVDTAGLKPYVTDWAAKYNKQDVPYMFNSYVKGRIPVNVLTVSYALDEKQLLKEMDEAVRTLTSRTIEAPFDCTRDGKPFDLDNTCIEVDIDNQQLTYYQDGKLIVHTDVVTGNLNGHATITGFFLADSKDANVTMKGEDYCVFSKYWLGISGEYGIHDAAWRTNFGGDFYVNGGSHGCVNVPEVAMAKIFEYAEKGTPIYIHGKNQWYQPSAETERIRAS